jgi:hypothetical protein
MRLPLWYVSSDRYRFAPELTTCCFFRLQASSLENAKTNMEGYNDVRHSNTNRQNWIWAQDLANRKSARTDVSPSRLPVGLHRNNIISTALVAPRSLGSRRRTPERRR